MERINWIFRSRTSCWNFSKQKSLKKSNIHEVCQTLKIIGVAISRHIISFRFLDSSEQLRKTKFSWFEAGKVALTGQRFLQPIEKILISLITGELVYVYSTISMAPLWWSRRFIYLIIFSFTSVFLLIMWSQPASIAWTVTSALHFNIVEITWNNLIYEFNVL